MSECHHYNFDELVQLGKRDNISDSEQRSAFQKRRSEYAQTKVFHHPDRIQHILNGEYLKVVPVSVELDVTNICPHKCFYCYEFISDDLGLNWDMHRPGDETNYDRAQALLYEMAKEGVRAVEYCGRGEPFQYGRFVDLLNVTRNAGLQAGIITSGSLIDEDTADKLVEASPTWIRFSIDSLNPTTFDIIRQPRRENVGCETVKANMRRLSKVFLDNKVPCRLSASTVVLPKNYQDVRDLARFTKELGFKAHVFRLVNLKNRERLYRPIWDELSRVLEETQRELEDESFSVYLPPKDFYKKEVKQYKRCLFSLFDMAIDVNFNVFGCLENIFNPDYLIGNIGPNGMSFKDLLNSPRRIEVMNRVKLCPPCCRDEANEQLDGFVNAVHPNFV